MLDYSYTLLPLAQVDFSQFYVINGNFNLHWKVIYTSSSRLLDNFNLNVDQFLIFFVAILFFLSLLVLVSLSSVDSCDPLLFTS